MSAYEGKSWGHTPFVPAKTALYGEMHEGFDLHIVRIEPYDCGVKIEWLPLNNPEISRVKASIYYRGCTVGFANNNISTLPPPKFFSPSESSCQFDGLVNGIDYEVNIFALDENNLPVARSHNRLLRSGHFPGTVVNYLHPDDFTFAFSGRSPASPSIVKLPSGALLVSHDFYWHGAGQNLTTLFRSEDDGKNWRYVTDIAPCFCGKLFYCNDALYMLGLDSEYGNYLIGRSHDEGETWSTPVRLLQGGDAYKGGPHQVPTPVIFHSNRVWTAVEWGWRLKFHQTGVISGDLNTDLLAPSSWVLSPYVEHDSNWEGAVKGGEPAILEGNLLPLPDGTIGNLIRYHAKGAMTENGLAVLLKLDPKHPEKPQEFVRVVNFEGNITKFHALFDETTKLYHVLFNSPDKTYPWRRDILSLAVSNDAVNWHKLADLINYRDNNWQEGPVKTAFQYPSWVKSDEDIFAVSRTALNGAWNFHNANAITFHKFEGYLSSNSIDKERKHGEYC